MTFEHTATALPDSPRLLTRVRDKIRLKHYSIRTEHAYVAWIRRFIRFHGKRHPTDLGPTEVESFLTDLAVAHGVAASTQNQAKSALLFLYKEVLGIELPWLDGIDKAKVPRRLPVVLTREETKRALEQLHDIHALIGRLLYGTGMRVMEGMRLRVKDMDFARREILIRDGKGYGDRVTVLPRAIESSLREQLEHARKVHRHDLAAGSAPSGYRMRLHANTRKQTENGRGSTSFPQPDARAIQAPALFVGITSQIRRFSARCGRLSAMQGSRSPRLRTRCVTPSRPICWSRVTIFELCRNCLGTPTSARR